MPAFTAVAYVPVIILERPLFLRERNDGLYRVITYLSFKISAVRRRPAVCSLSMLLAPDLGLQPAMMLSQTLRAKRLHSRHCIQTYGCATEGRSTAAV